MTGPFSHLLALDALVSQHGRTDGLNPALRAAMDADQRWPSRSGGPATDAKTLPDGGAAFPPPPKDRKKTA